MEATSGGTATGRSAVLVGGTTHAEAGADWTLAASARDSGTWWPAPWQAECTCRCSTLRVSKQSSQNLWSQTKLPGSTNHLSYAACAIVMLYRAGSTLQACALNRSCTILCRTPHLAVNHTVPGGTPEEQRHARMAVQRAAVGTGQAPGGRAGLPAAAPAAQPSAWQCCLRCHHLGEMLPAVPAPESPPESASE